MNPRTMLGSFIRDRRQELGLSVHELSERSGLTESAIYMIERGDRTRLQPDTCMRLSAALEVGVDALLSESVRASA